MNKILVTLLSFCLSLSAFAQDYPIDPETQLITYTEVVEVPDISKAELYNRAHTWLTRAFKGSTKQVIELDDKEGGKLVGRGLLPIRIKIPITGMTDAGSVSTTVTLFAKDGKYKYIFDNLTHEKPDKEDWNSAGPLEQKKPKSDRIFMKKPGGYEWRWIKEATDVEIKRLTADLKKSMTKKDADF